MVGKVFAKVPLTCLKALACHVYPESQCGFRSERSTIDMIFFLRQLQEKCREQRIPLYISFIDLTKAFDLVSRDGLFEILPKVGCLSKANQHYRILLHWHEINSFIQWKFIRSFSHKRMMSNKVACWHLHFLEKKNSLVLKHGLCNWLEGIFLQLRRNGKLFNLSRLKARTKVTKLHIRDLLFANDAAVATHSEQSL